MQTEDKGLNDGLLKKSLVPVLLSFVCLRRVVRLVCHAGK